MIKMIIELSNPLLLGYINEKPIYEGEKSRLCCLLTDIERIKNTLTMGEILIQGLFQTAQKDITLGLKMFDCTSVKNSLYNLHDKIMTEVEIQLDSDIKFSLLRKEYKHLTDEEWEAHVELTYHCINEMFKCNTRATRNMKLNLIPNE
ncbi:hypothetical protein FD724_35990 (plasmid) [Nostoc sp. C057]|uniref:hypothetical protein n=1 Tax=Nostoc sp. C057 TaxID=2576903 RepID=UPI0015C30A9F|nr:hypothetical protein [Nostoc sp. C057]QLE53311.1 hypothetical protein FD724_35990 [Nostoc sp. C057]